MNEMPKIEGVDFEDGLKRLRNNTQMYKRLLNRFFSDKMLEGIAQSIRQNDINLARHQAHSIKGSAANLGLTGISDVATIIDRMLKPDDAQITQECIDLADKLVDIIAITREKINKIDW